MSGGFVRPFSLVVLLLVIVVSAGAWLRGSDGAAPSSSDVVVVTKDGDAVAEAVPALESAAFFTSFDEALAVESVVLVFDETVEEEALEGSGQLRDYLERRTTVVALNLPLAVLEQATSFASQHASLGAEDPGTNTRGYDDPYFSFVFLDADAESGMNWMGKGQKEIHPYLAVQLPEFAGHREKFDAQRREAAP